MASAGMPPGRSSVAMPPGQPTMVDSTPTAHGPASSTAAIRPSRPPSGSRTCSALVGLMRPGGIGRGRRERAGRGEHRLRRGMGRHAQRDGRQSGGDERRDAGTGAQWQDQSQGAGPEGLRQGQRLGREVRDPAGGGQVRDMHDQRVEAGAALGRVDPCDGLAVCRVGGKAIDRLGRDRHGLARRKQPGGLGDAGVVGGKAQGVHVTRGFG